jgi:excisionase family DNA binding protein
MGEQREELRRLLSSREVADYCRVCAETVRRWVEAGKLTPAGRVPGGHYLFDLVAVDAFLGIAPAVPSQQRSSPGPAPAPAHSASVPARQLSPEEADHFVERAYESVMRESLRKRGKTDAEIEKEFASRRRHRDATRRAMNDPDTKRRVREGMARYWSDPEKRRKRSEAVRRRNTEQKSRGET